MADNGAHVLKSRRVAIETTAQTMYHSAGYSRSSIMRIASAHRDHDLYLSARARSEGKRSFAITARRVREDRRSPEGLSSDIPYTLNTPPLLRGRDTTRSGWEFPQNGSHSTGDEALQQSANVLPYVIYVVAPVTSKAGQKLGTFLCLREPRRRELTPPRQKG